jgi:hypothetical protein
MSATRLRHLALATAVFFASASTAHAQQDFYEPPSPLPPGKPGDLIRWEAAAAQASGGNDLPGNAWRILYRSTSATGKPMAVSGMVLVPDAPLDGKRPLIGYSVGTRGLADRCAPSRNIPDGGEPEANTIRDLLEHGWAVSVTDWEGLGTPGDHTYVVGRAEGQAVLDGIRAARRLEEAALPTDGPLALMGYSQGGHSTSWAAQVQPRYAPELRLSGAAAGAVPSNLQRAAENIDGGVAAGLVLYAAIGMDTAYPELQLERYLNDEGRQAVEEIRDTCVLDGTVFEFGFRESREYTTTDVPALPAWDARLTENGVGAIAPDAPMFLYHARRDELIPYELSEDLRARWCRQGVNVTLAETQGADHSVTGTSLGNPVAIDWLAERFASGPPPQPGECPFAGVRLRFGFPGGLRHHATRRALHVHARTRGGTLRDLTFVVRNTRGRVVGRSARRDLRGTAHIRIGLRRRIERGRRYAVVATGRRPDGSRLRRRALVRLGRSRL